MRRCVGLLLSCLAAPLLRPAAALSEYFAVCDAGSTGTRLYIFNLDIGKATAKAIFVKKTKPGLSSYADNPTAAVAPLLELLKEGADEVPWNARRQVRTSILGTAGMRMLDEKVQRNVWTTLKKGLLAEDSGFPFGREMLEARTAQGLEEGTWALMTANFLTGRVSHSLVAKDESLHPLGLMDLGGSSTQIAVPSIHGAVVQSYLGFGMTHIREQIHNESVGGEDMGCYMRNTDVGGRMGQGDAVGCRKLISRVLAGRTKACRSGGHGARPCLGDLGELDQPTKAIKSGSVDFFGVAGMMYVVDFVRWWLDLHKGSGGELSAGAKAYMEGFPRPTIEELQAATDLLCKGDYGPLSKLTGTDGAHKYTAEDNAPFRCFQANYILVLLEEIYGFPRDGRKVTFALEHEGEDLEWPLGAMLFKRAGAPVPGVRRSELQEL